MKRALWPAALAAGLLWPARTLGPLDGLPLNGTADTIVIAVAIPLLWVTHRQFLDLRWVRGAIVLLVSIKVVGAAALTQQGLCARFSTPAPLHTSVLTIPIDEPLGLLRSWDVRADWRSATPACTAIIDRPYPTPDAFPAWFSNLTRTVDASDVSRRDPANRSIDMQVRGVATVREGGRFSIDSGPDMTMTGLIGSEAIESPAGRGGVALAPGAHRLNVHAALTGSRWTFVPAWNGRDAFAVAMLTIDQPAAFDRWLAPLLRFGSVFLVWLLTAGWIGSVMRHYRRSPLVFVWTIAASVVLAAAAASGRFERVAPIVLVLSAWVPLAPEHRNWRAALLLAGVPWLVLFVVRSLPQIGRFSQYSVDDWLAYQVAGYRIYMNGYWLQGGSPAFDYQPLYRWISGALHLAFGDSSVGEVYWDAVCLLAGGLATFVLVEPRAGFRWAVAAAALTLTTFTVSSIWYFIGRGLSEIAAAGFAFVTAVALLRARAGRTGVAAVAGVLATLMFYTRLNHLLFAGFLLALLALPIDAVAVDRATDRAVRRVKVRAALIYGAVFACGVTLFALRTWWYTGVFSVLYGTSSKNNDTGLRLATLASPDVWRRVGHSLSALVWMNEPPSPDLRALLVVVGAMLSVLALAHVPVIRRLPRSIATVTVGAGASALFAHTHNYPGRMSIHLVPFAVSAAAIVAKRVVWPAPPSAPPAGQHQPLASGSTTAKAVGRESAAVD